MTTNQSINKPRQNPLFQAYHNGEFDQFKTLIDNGENINCLDDNKQSLINHIIVNPKEIPNNKEFFDLLINKGVDLSPNSTNKGLLTVAVRNQTDIYYARKLLENNINVNSFGKYMTPPDDLFNFFNDRSIEPYGPPIFDALTYQNIDYVNLFIKYNFDVNMPNHKNQSVIEYFISKPLYSNILNPSKHIRKDEKIFRLLIDYGADIDILDIDGNNLLGTIIKSEDYHLMEILFEKAPNINVNHRNFNGITSLMQAVSNRDIDIIKLLIKKGANLNYYDNQGNNALMNAVLQNDIHIFKLLIDAGADFLVVNKNNNNNTILHSLIDFESKYMKREYDENWFDDYYKIILEKHPQLLSTKNKKGEIPIDILKNNNKYTSDRKKFFNKFKENKKFFDRFKN